jgi:hypothetical protein
MHRACTVQLTNVANPSSTDLAALQHCQWQWQKAKLTLG